MIDPSDTRKGGAASDEQKPQEESSPIVVVGIMVLCLVALIVWYRFK
jgi:hypothetical protein